jgi:predicted nucleotidyltransferase
MRKPSAIQSLFSPVRRGLLAATYLQPAKWWYLSELAEHLGTTPSTLQRELAALVADAILEKRREGTRVYFRAQRNSPLYPELRRLMEKTAGIIPVLQQFLAPLGAHITAAFVFGSVARDEAAAASDVDLVVVGDIGLADLSPLLRKAENRIGREINPMVFSRAEYHERAASGDHFLTTVLKQPKQFVVGGLSELEQVAGQPAGTSA